MSKSDDKTSNDIKKDTSGADVAKDAGQPVEVPMLPYH